MPQFLKKLGLAYADTYCSGIFYKTIKGCQDIHLKNILKNIYEVWSYNILENDWVLFIKKHFINSSWRDPIRDKIVALNQELIPDTYKIIDAIAIPDELLGSPIAYSDANMYQKFLSVV